MSPFLFPSTQLTDDAYLVGTSVNMQYYCSVIEVLLRPQILYPSSTHLIPFLYPSFTPGGKRWVEEGW